MTSALALALFTVYLALAFGLRSLRQLRCTGSSGFKGISGRPGSVEWLGGVLFTVSLALHLAAPLLDLAGTVRPLFDPGPGGWLGAALIILGATGTFALVRNPIFAAMIPASLGMALMVPNIAAAVALLLLVAAIELQVRLVEEPYLIRIHGQTYLDYASRTGRFLPNVGLLGTRAPR